MFTGMAVEKKASTNVSLADEGLEYGLDPHSNHVKRRNYYRYPALFRDIVFKNTFPEQGHADGEVRFTFHAGNKYINPQSSYFSVDYVRNSAHDLANDATTHVWLRSFLSLISDVRLLSSRGVELDFCDHVDALDATMADTWYSDHWLKAQGVDAGYDTEGTFSGNVYGDRDTETRNDSMRGATTTRLIVPLACLLGIFRGDRLLPPHIMDQATLRIRFKPLTEATSLFGFRSTVPTLGTDTRVVDVSAQRSELVTTVTDEHDNDVHVYLGGYDRPGTALTNCSFVLDEYLIDGAVHDQVTKKWYNEGLQLEFESYHTERVENKVGSGVATVPVTRDLSCVNWVVGRLAHELHIGVKPSTAEPMYNCNAMINPYQRQSYTWGLKSIQVRHGNLSYPNSPVTNWRESFAHWVHCFGKQHPQSTAFGRSFRESFVGQDKYAARLHRHEFQSHATDEHMRPGTGVPVNSSNPLSVEFGFFTTKETLVREFPLNSDSAVQLIGNTSFETVVNPLTTANMLTGTSATWGNVKRILYVFVAYQKRVLAKAGVPEQVFV